ncbi:uncharacterized protein LOC133288950 [Gastrolobium bilobum]|uniref:uncharacterized protein LOC133288950 n=1 Tax=Gastrolobium bilobum TaxID=150636 RepID=UPI002AB1F694|nr:uncharacterized protein LOC133288950 [Gastrolobium bilobum]
MAKYGEEPCSFTYDVFLSFRGEDTRHIFIAPLRRELRLKGISTFVDDENLRIGEGISPSLRKAIEESRILIIVLSENYASSRWCLDELVEIVNCIKRNNKQLVFPIFYHVDPTDVRHQKNHYREAMNAHEDRFGKDSEKVQAWRSALTEVANLKGHHISDGYVPKPLHIDQNPVGLESRTEAVKLLLDMKPHDDTVCMLGIYGAGGIGKTALARTLYNKIAHEFEAASFLANVREKSNKINGIEDLQKTLLSEMLVELETELGSTSEGISEIKLKLQGKNVLLVLDDVDDKEMLEKLAGGCDWFGSGSRVIITTRDKDLLIAHQVEKKYEMTELDDQHSLQLFCLNAFKRSYPPTGFEDLSSRAVGYAQGLPLALKVIGSDLAMAQSLDAWESALKEYERIPKKSIQNVLKISFDRLEENAQRVFLDIACFFKGERKESVEKILEDQSVTEMPDVSEVQNLIELRLDNCKNLIAVHESVGFLKNLLHLSVSECTKLRNFLQRMFLPSLEVLDLNLCVSLEHFPDVVEKMTKPLEIYMINTAIKELPHSIGNLIGLVCIEMPSSRKLRYLPSSLFMLPNVVAFKMGGCSQLRESFTRFIEGPSAAEGCSPLQRLYFDNGGLSDEDLHAVLKCFPKLEELIASENNFVSLPACIKESVHLTSLDVSVCKNLKRIPECTDLRILNVHRCVKLEDISDLPSTIQKVDARYCFSLTRETSTMLWSQVSKEIRGLEDVNEMAKQSRTQLVELHLFINGRCVPRKGYYNFRIAADHVLLCDLRLLFSDEEWHGLDAFLEHDWNIVQVSYAATLALSCWGVYVYKQGTEVDDVQFMCPDPEYSDIANISRTIIPTRDSKMEKMKMIESSGLERMFDRMLIETMNYEEREGFADKDFSMEAHQVLMGGLKKISSQAKDLLESNGKGSALEGKKSTLEWLLDTINKGDEVDGPGVFFHEDLAVMRLKGDELKPSMGSGSGPHQLDMGRFLEGMSKRRMDEGEASISRHQGSGRDPQQLDMGRFFVDMFNSPINIGEALSPGHQGSGSDPQQEQILMGIFWDGMEDGLLEAQNSFPSLDIETTRCAALNKGNRVAWSLPESGVLVLPQVEEKTYIEGIFNGLMEAKQSFPTLDIEATLNTVLSRAILKVPTEAPPVIPQVLDSTTVMVPCSDDPLLQAFMMMKPESCESEAKSKLYCKLKEEHKALRQRFEEFENESVDQNKDTDAASYWKNQYDELLEKFNTQSAELISKKNHNLDGTDDAEAKATNISDSNSALISTEMHTAIGIGGCKGVAKYEKLAAVLKGRDEELRRLYDAGIEGFHNSEEFQDLMSAIYLNGLRDGILEAQAISLALDMERMIPVFKENEKHATDEEEAAKEEHVTDEEAANEKRATDDEAAQEEHVTDEVAKEKHIETADNENLDETIGAADIPGPTDPEVYNSPETSNPSSS